MSTFIRPPLKWAGGKFRLLGRILPALPPGKRLVEPFVGSGAVFLNADYPAFLLCDLNQDLVNFHRRLISGKKRFIKACAEFFQPRFNDSDEFYALRERFNGLPYDDERAALLLYLNRHGFNGLVRYNAKGKFNTPFGRYVAPYFPRDEMEAMILKAKKTAITFAVMDFRETFASLEKGDVVYCDPPYAPLSETANFTAYTAGSFGPEEQRALSACAAKAGREGNPVILSNHNTEFTRALYGPHVIESFDVRRFISCDGANRANAQELLAVYG